ncbi:hypothetical protein KAR91_09360 [Candidatus Pacearchaeota archaeon]|nr:hypothetical protein [Candidatus Pacearchaeota archaeon]
MYDVSEVWIALLVWLVIGIIFTFFINPRILIRWIGHLYNDPDWVKKHMGALHDRLVALIVKGFEDKMKLLIPGMVQDIMDAMLTQVRDVIVRDISEKITISEDTINCLKDDISKTMIHNLQTFKASISHTVQAEMKHKEKEVTDYIHEQIIEEDPLLDLKQELYDAATEKYPIAKFAPLIANLIGNENGGSHSTGSTHNDPLKNAW